MVIFVLVAIARRRSSIRLRIRRLAAPRAVLIACSLSS